MKNVALITGASLGIWKEFAFIHAKQTWDLVLVARNKEKLEKIKDEIESSFSRKVVVISKDLSNPNSPKELYDEIKKQGIEIDYLINNAWFGGQWFFHKRDFRDDKNMIQLNITTLTELTRYFLEDMVKRWSGKILNVSSTASYMPGPLQAVYYASKSFVQFFSNALSRELEWTWVTVTNLMPWATETWFEKTAWLQKTQLFAKTASANKVALDWYNAMLNWKMDVISWLTFWQRFALFILPFIPKKISLDIIFKMQSKAE